MNYLSLVLKSLLAILLLLCLLQMPYGYYQLVRFLGMVIFGWLAFIDSKRNDKTLFIIWISSAILINPLVKIALGRTIWNIVDVIWAILLIATIWTDKKNPSVQNRS
jgi:hypothetical protein